ncbi:MAG TPA: D-alanine--D-alanine ligase [Bacteroidetes bacterium]|nr:D-alanine--D-alanine ligase [Bacteroidota bacterium]
MNVAILFGGKSAEHEISIRSANNVFKFIDRIKFNPILIKIDKNGRWLTDKFMVEKFDFSEIKDISDFNPADIVVLNPGSDKKFIIKDSDVEFTVDVVHPVLHGPNGEDGSMQGLLKILNLPFVGPGVLGSAVGMDKEIMKRLLKESGIKIGDYLVARYGDFPDFETVKSELGLPVYIKPANMGSSVGISRVSDSSQYKKAIDLAYKYDTKLVIEANIDGREVECAVLGNENPKASVPGEVAATKEFYDYEAKYLDDNGYEIKIPADLDKDTETKVRETALKTFKILECEGLSRVDVFVTKDNDVIVNEINTLPGFTSISMYPMLWKASGIEYTDLISKLLFLAIDRFERDTKLENSI